MLSSPLITHGIRQGYVGMIRVVIMVVGSSWGLPSKVSILFWSGKRQWYTIREYAGLWRLFEGGVTRFRVERCITCSTAAACWWLSRA